MKDLLYALIFTALSLIATSPSFAITDGELDGDSHPGVVLILMEVNGVPSFRCSGVLIYPKYVLTAGHCTGEMGEFSGMRVFTESDVQNGNNSYPYEGANSVEAVRWASHPDYTSNQFVLHDVGVIELAEPVLLPPDKYATLPMADALDQLATQRGLQGVTFTAVGYGLQYINPVFVESERIRMFSTPHLLQINTPGFTGDFSMLLSNNHSTGGTCFGDSGGPNFLGNSNIVAGITSFGINGNCAGTGGVFRLDRQDVIDFVYDFANP